MKGFLFAITHSLPTAMLMLEDGNIVAQHGGSDAGDAKYWLMHYLPLKLAELKPPMEVDDIEIITLDQELVEKHLYGGEPMSILGKDVKKAFDNNQKLKKEKETKKKIKK
jgi:hypothetical protein